MDQQGRWDAFNQFSLWGDLDRYTKLLARYELFKLIVDKPGDIVEGGVLKGAGVLYWARLIQIFNPMSRRKVIGFDTFESYPQNTSRVYDRKTAAEYTKAQVADQELVSVETIMDVAKQQGLADRIELVKGDASDTVEKYVTDNPGLRVALLNLDFVLYEPTLAAMKHLYPRVISGGIIALDEYAVHDKGESEAVDEVLQGQQAQMRSFSWAKSPTAYIVKE